MNKPYMGKILMVDLSDQTITEEKIPDSVYEAVPVRNGTGCIYPLQPHARRR